MPQGNTRKIPWLERHSGLLTSIVLFIALFFILAAKAYRQDILPPQSQPIRIHLQPAAAAPSEQEAPNTPPPPDVAATREKVDGQPEEQEKTEAEPNEPDVIEVATNEAFLPEPMFLISDEGPLPEPMMEEAPDLAESRGRAQAMLETLENEKFEIQKFLQKEQLNVRAQEFEFNTRGLAEGAVRTFDITLVPEVATEYVFKKYGIRIIKQRMTGGEAPGFLNAAKTRQGVYTNRPGSGMFEVFQISPRAQAKMGELERAAIKSRGLNPNKTQVQEVVFSVGQVGGEWDMVIRTFKAREIE